MTNKNDFKSYIFNLLDYMKGVNVSDSYEYSLLEFYKMKSNAHPDLLNSLGEDMLSNIEQNFIKYLEQNAEKKVADFISKFTIQLNEKTNFFSSKEKLFKECEDIYTTYLQEKVDFIKRENIVNLDLFIDFENRMREILSMKNI